MYMVYCMIESQALYTRRNTETCLDRKERWNMEHNTENGDRGMRKFEEKHNPYPPIAQSFSWQDDRSRMARDDDTKAQRPIHSIGRG